MGNSESSLPVALEERNRTYRSPVHMTEDFYHLHTSGQNHLPTALTALPPALTDTVSLYQNVDLSFNLIKEIPLDLPLRLPHLRHLNLSHNRLLSLPQSLFGFLHLEHLDVSHNLLSHLPTSLCLLSHLTWLDVSHNNLTLLPDNLDELTTLEKLNVTQNQLEHLPISLGALPRLTVLLVNKNPLCQKLKDLCDSSDCSRLIKHLQSQYRRSQSELSDRSNVNEFCRERGSVFDSRVLNAGSAQSLFAQLQAQAVQTGNRLLTPMIPPVGATTLDVDQLRDSITGMFYGAVIGDSLGLLTQHMTPTEAEFYYSASSLDHASMHVDRVRCCHTPGDVTLPSHLVLTLLESIIKWGGVVDELDYVERLCALTKDVKHDSSVLKGLYSNLEEFRSNPAVAAEQWLRQPPAPSLDNMCLPPVVALVMSQFHREGEVCDNAARICKATHPHEENAKAATCLAKLLTKLLQGRRTKDALEEAKHTMEEAKHTMEEAKHTMEEAKHTLEEAKHTMEEAKHTMEEAKHAMEEAKDTLSHQGRDDGRRAEDVLEVNETGRPWECLEDVVKAVEMYLETGEDGFRVAVSGVVMKGGHATVTGCVTGAVLGILTGYTNLPKAWVQNINGGVRRNLDKKLNNLFDLMGVP